MKPIQDRKFARRLLPLMVVALSQGMVKANAQIEEVVVTAQKKAESLQDAPLAVTAFTADMLEDIGAYDATDVAEYTPNVSIVPIMGSSVNIRMEIRGMSTAEPSLTVDPKVGIYLDGAYIARNSGAVFDIVDLERVEVLRGPQGTLWGKNTTGGALNLITRRPDGEFGFKQQLSTGNDGYIRSVSTMDSPMLGTVAGKFTYMHKQYDGWATNHGEGESNLASEEVDAFRIALAWDISENLLLDYSYDNTRSDSVPPPLQITAVSAGGTSDAILGTYDISQAQFYPYNALQELAPQVEKHDRIEDFTLDNVGQEEVEIEGHNVTLTWDFAGITFKSISSYRKYDSDFPRNDLDGGTWGLMEDGVFTALPIFHASSVKEQDQFQQELQALGTAFDGALDYVIGLYYFEEEGEEVNPWNATVYQSTQPVLLRGIPLGSYYGIDNKSRAVFGQFTYRPSDDYYLTLGLRYTEDEKGLKLLAEDPRLTEGREFDEDWSKFTPAFTAGYQPSDDLNVYFKYAEGFNAGIYGIPTDPNAEVIEPADEEELTAYEIGLKSMWLDNTLRLNVAAFFNDADNLQITAFVEGNRTVINSGSAEIYGVEVETTWMPNANWAVDANYGYRETDRDTIEDVADADGKHSGRLGIAYYRPMGDWGLLNARLDASYKDEINYSTNGSADVKDRWLLGARLGLSEVSVGGGNLRAALWGKNLTDEEYGVHGQDLGLEGGYGISGVVFGQPRSYGIDLIWEY
ncbi:MAG: TonB-dependent receptor [Gammaproteobacteria bacterium]|nr:TonB-dependent receptor [Gammaproteobacteria bacterium]